MKKNTAIVLVVTAVLLVVALAMMGTVGLSGKLTKGGCAVRINVGSSYDAEKVSGYVKAAGFNSPVVLESGKTALEIETGTMSASALDTAAQKLLSSLQADYSEAELVYAETFGAVQGVHHFRNLVYAAIALAVLGYLYGALRFGWLKGIAPVLTALVSACLTGSVCALLSGVFAASATLVGIIAGTACLAYVFAVTICGKMKDNAGYAVSKADLAVPILTVVACVLLVVCTASVQALCPAVLGSVIAAAGMYCLAPMFWKTFTR